MRANRPNTRARPIAYSLATIRALAILFREASPRKALRILELGRRPIVIGGCARSGTTLLLSILSCHPRILAIGEETVALCPDGYTPEGHYNAQPKLDAPFMLWNIYRSLNAQDIPRGCRRWCEKTPRNVLYFERILHHFGSRVRILHLVRDGRDVVTSRHPRDPSTFWVSAKRWVQDVSAGRALEGHPQVHTVRYEDLLRDYDATLRRICNFIGEEFVDGFRSYPESSRVKKSVAWSNPASELSTSSVGRWREPEYARRVRALLADPNAVELLKHYGYAAPEAGEAAFLRRRPG